MFVKIIFLPTLHRIFGTLRYLSHVNTQKAQTSCCLFTHEVLALPTQSNKQQETYAGMKTHYTQTRCSMDIIIPIGIYCYFGFDLVEKLRSFLLVKRKASINAITICPHCLTSVSDGMFTRKANGYCYLCCSKKNCFCCSISWRNSSSVGIYGIYLAAKICSLSCNTE